MRFESSPSRMTDLEKLEEILELAVGYAGIDSSHRKQFALVQIVKIIMGDNFDSWYEDCFRALNAIGYDGPISIEWKEGTP